MNKLLSSMMLSETLTGHKCEAVGRRWERDIWHQGLTMMMPGTVRLSPGGWVLPPLGPKFLNKIYNFEFRPDDVIVMTFPKSGTTWLQEILWTMIHNPGLDHPEAHKSPMVRCPDISFDMNVITEILYYMFTEQVDMFHQYCPDKNLDEGLQIQVLEAMPGRRVIKSHLPPSLFHPDILEKTKVVYVARNPKDTLVSSYSFFKLFHYISSDMSLETYARLFMDGSVQYGPYWAHVRDGWQRRQHHNLHFVFYEDLKKDPVGEMRRLNNFINTDLTDQQLEAIAEYCSFDNMKARGEPLPLALFDPSKHKPKNGEVGSFYRKGKTGDWKNHLSPELEKEVDDWVERNITEIGITFDWEAK